MNARLVQCVSIAGFIQNIRFGLGKIDDHRYRLADQPLNLIDDAALKFAPVDSFAHCAHLLGGLTHRNEKYILAQRHRQKRSGSPWLLRNCEYLSVRDGRRLTTFFFY